MKKALVLGASGAMGYAIVNELVERGLHVCAFARNKEHLEQLFGNNKQIEIFAGDVLQWEELYQAATDCELIFHSINLPYQEWENSLLLILKNVLSVTKEYSAKLVFVDNIYSYGRSNGGK